MSLDDVYNHIKVYEPEVQKSTVSSSQNMAFISSSNTSSGKGDVPTTSVLTASIQVSTASTDVLAASLSHDTICAYIATQSSGSQIKFEDITQIDDDNIKEIDIKWNLALLSMRDDRFWKKTGHFARECRAPRCQDKGKKESYRRDPKVEEPAPKALMAIDGIGWDWSYMADEEENHALVADDVVPTEFAIMAMSISSSDNEVYDDSYCFKSCRKNTENLNTKINKLTKELSDCETDLYHYKKGLSQVEVRLVEFKVNETKFCKRIRVLERDIEVRDNKIEYLKNELEKVKKEKENIDHKLTGFEKSSNDLDSLFGEQRIVKDKTGVGFNEYTSVPPPPIQVYSPPKKDLSWTSLLEFADDTITNNSRPTPSVDISKGNNSELEGNHPCVAQVKSSGSIMSKPMIKFVKETGCLNATKINNAKNVRKPIVQYAEIYRNTSQNTNGNIDDKGYWDSGYSRHITGNISYLSEYEPYDGGYVSFGHEGGKITECLVLGKDFKVDDSHVLLRTPRQHNMYSIDLNNIVPHKNLTCLVAKASVDESMLWHRRLGHLNFKTMNKLVRNNPVRGLPSKSFENDHSCVDCLKGKQHKASCKTKCDNGGEFKNREMDEFYTKKGIKRELSNARTPQQNGVAKRRNRTLIEAARTMVLVNKSYNKTPYELFNGRTPAIGFLRPFGCHVMIFNTLDNLGKFYAKGDEGYFVEYSLSSKVFRVFNKRTKKVEENLHVDFLETKPIEKGVGPN
ncbi:ribonuclease H-like domain-containing protein [Tanacetum coccineum]